MIIISQTNEEKVFLKNINILTKKETKELLAFLRLNSEIFKELNFLDIENKISFSNENLILLFNQLEKQLLIQNIDFEFDASVVAFKSKQKYLEKKNNDLIKIGQNFKMSQDIPEEYKIEYEEFKCFCENNFSINHIPFENQIKSAFFHLKMEKSCNFSSPGTGKTTIVYSLFNWLKNKQESEIDAIFIIGPISSLLSWRNEYKECFGKYPFSIDFNIQNFKRELNNMSPNSRHNIIYFLNYEKVKSHRNELVNFFKKYRILLVLDEAHRIKNPNSKRTNYLSEILNNIEVNIPYQIILTGTPLPNGYENLYSYFDLTKKNKLPILFKTYEELKKIESDDENEISEIFQQVSPFFYSLRKKDMENFKDPIYLIIDCDMDNFQEKLFNTIKKRLVDNWNTDIDQRINLEFFRSKIIRLMQIQTDIRMLLKPVDEIIFYSNKNNLNSENFLEEQTNAAVKEILEKRSFELDMKELKLEFSEIKSEIEKYNKENKIPDKYLKLLNKVKELIKNDEKVIIWSSWVYCLNQIANLLRQEGINYGLLYGATTYEIREKYIEDFNNKKNRNLMVLVANPASVGESISLHKVCQNAIYFDINYNVTNHFQSKDRIHRCGMPEGKEQVTYYYLLSKNSIEKNILLHIQSKEAKMNDFLDNNKNLFVFKDSDFNNFMPDIEDINKMLR